MSENTADSSAKVMLTEMTWPEVGELVGRGALVVLPVASTEQHGPHLPLSTDAVILSECVRRAAERVRHRIPIAVAPTLPFGFSEHHMAFPGTLSLSVSAFLAALTDLCQSLIRHGFRRVLLVNGHGGNREVVQVAVRQVMSQHRAVIGATDYWEVAGPALEAAGAGQVGLVPGHSAGFETTCMLALRPDLVHLDRLPTTDLSVPTATDARSTVKPLGVMTAPHREQRPETGVWGDPTLVRPELGPALVQAIVHSLADVFEAFARTEGH
ncbi:MAG: creatininase family protein [Anaerolineae bacterium]|nr:creatininase family protein [Anaerolineae bacterium]